VLGGVARLGVWLEQANRDAAGVRLIHFAPQTLIQINASPRIRSYSCKFGSFLQRLTLYCPRGK
jgi:hypothetical protein